MSRSGHGRPDTEVPSYKDNIKEPIQSSGVHRQLTELRQEFSSKSTREELYDLQ